MQLVTITQFEKFFKVGKVCNFVSFQIQVYRRIDVAERLNQSIHISRKDSSASSTDSSHTARKRAHETHTEDSYVIGLPLKQFPHYSPSSIGILSNLLLTQKYQTRIALITLTVAFYPASKQQAGRPSSQPIRARPISGIARDPTGSASFHFPERLLTLCQGCSR